MTFELLTLTKVKIRSINLRAEVHGKDLIQAADIGFSMVASNKLLLMLDPGLFLGAYTTADGKEPEPEIEGLEQKSDRPKLRWAHVKGPIVLDNEYPGRNLVIAYGTRGKSDIDLFGDVNSFKVLLHDGGSAEYLWRFQVSGLEDKLLGRLGSLLQHEAEITLLSSSAADNTQETLPGTGTDGPQPDPANPFKSTAGEKGGIVDNHPSASPTATDIFAAGGKEDTAARKALADRAEGKTPRAGKDK